MKKLTLCRNLVFAVLGIATLAFAGCSTIEDLFEREKKIPLEQVPANVRAAAETAVPGIVLESAEIDKKRKSVSYEIEGRANGREYELEIDANGNVTAMKYDTKPEAEGREN